MLSALLSTRERPLDAELRDEIERFFFQHRRGVGSYALARVCDADEAESITSRVFLTVVRRWHQCRSSRAGWLWAIVRSEIARHFRDLRRNERLDNEISDPSRSPLEVVQHSEAITQMHLAIQQLTDEQREIVYMKFFQRMRNKDIASATGRSAENIGVMVHRALRRLKQLLAGAGMTNV